MANTDAVVANWSQLIGNFNTSAQEFYSLVEDGVKRRDVPDVRFARRSMREAGLFSSSREYLIVKRKDLTFAVCSAPYGTGHFFSWWLLQHEPLLTRIMRAIPFVGPFYEEFLNPKTFYSADTTGMFRASISACVSEAMEQVTSAQGHRLPPGDVATAA